MADDAADTERGRPLRVALLALGVEHLGLVHQQQRLAGHQPHPGPWLRGDERQCAIGPESRHFSRRQRSARGAFGQFDRVPLFVFGRAAASDERPGGAIGVRIVPEVEVRSELRGGHEEATADRVVARRDRQKHHRQAQKKGRGSEADAVAQTRSRLHVVTRDRPARDDRDQHHRVLAGKREQAQDRAEPPPPPRRRRTDNQAADHHERKADQDAVEHGLLDQRVEEHSRRIKRQQQSRANPHAPAKQARGRDGEEDTRQRTKCYLHETHDQKIAAGQRVQCAEEVPDRAAPGRTRPVRTSRPRRFAAPRHRTPARRRRGRRRTATA